MNERSYVIHPRGAFVLPARQRARFLHSGKIQRAQGFIEHDSYGIAQIQAAGSRHHGNAQAAVVYPAEQAFRQAAHSARQASKKLGLLVRRNALDRMNETMAVLPQYANPENQADLAVEAARVLAQIDQLEQCFTGTF